MEIVSFCYHQTVEGQGQSLEETQQLLDQRKYVLCASIVNAIR
jgi:hypothetical protein